MKPHSLLRLYPRAWRERYGEEFLALVESERPGPRLVLDVVRAAVGEWTFWCARSLGWHSRHIAVLDLLGMLRTGTALFCGIHMASWGWACISGWAFGPALSAHPEWWTGEALWLSASLQSRAAAAAAIVPLGLQLIFAHASYKTRSQVLDWLTFVTVIAVSVAHATFLDRSGPGHASVTTLLGKEAVVSLMIVPAVLVADWARARGRRALEPDDAREHIIT